MDNLTPITREEMLMNDEPLTPITREEKILAGEDLECVTRREYFLKKYRHAGGEVMVEGLSVTENGTYTAPDGKAYSPVNVAVPLPENAYLLKEASGSLVSFDDGADLPIPSFICNIDAVQDLHGQDAPWVGGAGRNKLQVTATSQTINGVTFTVNDDGTITANGTAGANTNFNVGKFLVDSNSCIVNGVSGGRGDTYYLQIVNEEETTQIGVTIDGDNTIPISANTKYKVRIRIISGVTVNNLVFKPMIRLSTETDATFAPYENICPISGHTGLDAWVRGKNLLNYDAWKVNRYAPTRGTAVYENNGITLTATEDNAYTTFLAEQFPNDAKIPVVEGDMVTLAWEETTNQTGVQYIFPEGNSLGSVYVDNRAAKKLSYTVPSGVSFVTFRFGVAYAGATIAYKNIQVIKGTTVSTYEPYNPNSQFIQVSWQTEAGEIFDGYIDLVSGELTATHKSQTGFTRGSQDSSNKLYNIGTIADIKAYTNASAISPYFVDSMFEKLSIQGARTAETPSIAHYNKALYVGGYIGKEAELDTLLESLQVKYELETPITYQLTPTQIKSLLGNNNAWCSTGDVDIDYFAKEV